MLTGRAFTATDFSDFRGALAATVTVDNLGLDLPAGNYFLTLRGVTDNDDQASFWGTTGPSPVNLTEGYFRSSDLGFPDWVPMSRTLGRTLDFSFQLRGVPGPGTAVGLVVAAGVLGARWRRVR